MDPPNDEIIYYNAYTILVINTGGKIRRLYAPFRVQCIEATDPIQVNTTLFVDEVFEDADDLILYKINGNLHPFSHFTIKISF